MDFLTHMDGRLKLTVQVLGLSPLAREAVQVGRPLL